MTLLRSILRPVVFVCLFALVAFTLAGCGGSSAPPAISVSVSPATATLIGGGTQTFTATVSNDSTNSGVTWAATTGSITSGGVYTAPAVITTTSATITATSVHDGSKAGTATVTLTPISVAVLPTTATLIGGATQQFTATVTADGSSSGVTWSATTGSISTSGLYTAPAVIGSTLSATITATSVKDTTKTATATVTLTPISVNAISPATASLGVGGTQAFTVTVANDGSSSGVTWSIGSGAGSLTSVTTTGVTYNAPTTAISTVTTVTLTATSIKDTTKSTTATITLNPLSVSIPTTPVAMIGGATQSFSATVTNDSTNSGVNWTVTSGGGSFSPTTTASGVNTTYTAANPVTTATAVLTATSVKDSTKSASVTVTLTPIAVSFTTVTTGITLDSGQTLPLAAAVANDSSASGVNFSITGGGAGGVSPLSATGNSPSTTLTATGTIASSVTVTATSIKDTTKSATTSSITVNPALAITTAAGALTAGTTNTPYAGATIATSGGTGTKTFAVASGSLPTGLTINSSTGAISGTVTGAVGTSTFTIRVTDSATTPASVTSGTYTITVSAAPLVWSAPTGGTFTYAVGTAITPITLSTTGGTGAITYSVNSGTLPTGLSISGNQLVGTPTQPTIVAGNAVTFKATDSATVPVTANSASVTLVVNPVTLVINSATLPTGYVGAAYNTSGYQFSSTGGTGAITWTMSPTNVVGLTLSTSGLLSGTPSGTYSSTISVTATDSATNQQQTKNITPTLTISNALTITTSTTLPNSTTGAAYNQTLAAAGGSGTGYTWTVTSGQSSLTGSNLSLSSAGVITGTPTAAATVSFTAQVTDSLSHTASATFTIHVYAPLTLPLGSTTIPGPGTVGVSYSSSISANGGVGPTYTFTVNGTALANNGSLVSIGDGLSVSSTGNGTLTISGTPTATASPLNFQVYVTDSASNVAGTLTYAIVVSNSFSISGNVGLVNNCNSSTLPTFTITLKQGTSTVQTVTTDSSGNYTLNNVVAGSYTIVPSITGPSSAFFPSTQSVTVSSSLTSENFSTALGYTVSGTISYSGSKSGPIYISLSGGCGGGSNSGTTLTAAGAYTINGVQPGTYTLSAYKDPLGLGAQNIADPTGTGSSGGVSVSNANVTGANLTIADPTVPALTSGPTLQGVAPFNNGVLVQFKAVTNSNGTETASSYTLQWATNSSFTGTLGQITLKAAGTGGANIWLLNANMPSSNCTNCSLLANNNTVYFRAYATNSTTAQSSYSIYNSSGTPIATIVNPSSGNAATVSGTVTFSATPTGPLYVGFYDYTAGRFYGQYFQSPASAQAFSVNLPTSSTYYFVSILDQNQNGYVDTGDLSNVNGNLPTTAITGSTAGLNLTLSNSSANLILVTVNNKTYLQAGSTYTVAFGITPQVKLPIAVQLISASAGDIPVPKDIAACTGCGSYAFQGYNNTGSTLPLSSNVYGFKITYSDGTTDTTPTMTGATVTNACVTSPSPSTGTSHSLTPTFTWAYPASASSYTYQFWISASSGNIWQIPGSNSNSNGFTSSQVSSIVWNTDPLGTGNLPSSALTSGTSYMWNLQTTDSNRNECILSTNYTP